MMIIICSRCGSPLNGFDADWGVPPCGDCVRESFGVQIYSRSFLRSEYVARLDETASDLKITVVQAYAVLMTMAEIMYMTYNPSLN